MESKPPAKRKNKIASPELFLGVGVFLFSVLLVGVETYTLQGPSWQNKHAPALSTKATSRAEESRFWSENESAATTPTGLSSIMEDQDLRLKLQELIEQGDRERCLGGSLAAARRLYDDAAARYTKARGDTSSSIYEQILLRQGIVFYMENDFFKAGIIFEKCVQMANKLNDQKEQMLARSWCSRARGMAGDSEGAAREFALLAEQYEKLEGPLGSNVGISLLYEGEQLKLATQNQSAIPVLKRTLKIFSRNGATQQQIDWARRLLLECQQSVRANSH